MEKIIFIFSSAARFHQRVWETPVQEIILECQHTHLLIHMQLASPVEVEDGVEGARMSVKEVFIVDQTVVSDQVHDLLVRLHSAESAES